MTPSSHSHFNELYATHLKKLRLHGYQPKTMEAYGRGVRRIGDYFGHEITDLSHDQLTDYFDSLLTSHSWSAVKLDLYGLKFFYEHVLRKPWTAVDLIQPPTSKTLPDILSPEEVQRVIAATRVVSYRVFFFTLYSLGLRLGEGLRLEVGDIDGAAGRVHVRNAKGNKDRFVPLPEVTYQLLRRFWAVHRHPTLLFPNRQGGLAGAAYAKSPLNRGGVQNALAEVVRGCGLKKRSPRTACAIATPPICSRPVWTCAVSSSGSATTRCAPPSATPTSCKRMPARASRPSTPCSASSRLAGGTCNDPHQRCHPPFPGRSA